MTWIAEQRVTWVLASGERRPGRIAIGMPIVVSDNEASCAYALDGLEYVAGPMLGAHTMQALCLALRFAGMRLHAFLVSGGHILNSDGEETGLEDVFGPLLADKLRTGELEDLDETDEP
ncbi:MAG TPA: hypothetical protein VNO30_22710 [Kofleriaceae bacterium]|nr:hypothetical protein [Kofleriaceae bacterium]